jgi:hypothetical protein
LLHAASCCCCCRSLCSPTLLLDRSIQLHVKYECGMLL